MFKHKDRQKDVRFINHMDLILIGKIKLTVWPTATQISIGDSCEHLMKVVKVNESFSLKIANKWTLPGEAFEVK